MQFPLQDEVVPLTSKHLQNFPGKKPHLIPTFKYLNYNYRAFRFPQTHDLSFSQTLHIPCLYVIMDHLVTDDFLGSLRYSSEFCLLLPCFSWRSLWFQLYSCQTVRLSQHHGRVLNLPKPSCHQLTSIIQNIKYYRLNDYSTRKWRGAPSTGLTNLAYASQQETH